MRVWVVVVVCTLGMSGMVHAEHTADHRYTIEGYVSNADGTPRPHELVAVMDRPDTRLGVAHADQWHGVCHCHARYGFTVPQQVHCACGLGDQQPPGSEKVKVFWTTPPYVDYNWTVRGDLDRAFVSRLTRAFLNLDATNPAHKTILDVQRATYYVLAREDDFIGTAEAARAAGLLKD